jgi:membrane protein DedA with SNARE-associated domain
VVRVRAVLETLDAWLTAVGPYGTWLLAAAACLEYLVPPFPGDTLLLLGGIYAVRGAQNPWLVLLAMTLGGSAGAWLQSVLGRRLSLRVHSAPEGSTLLVSHGTLLSAVGRLRATGTWLLLVNRFFPGIRAFAFVGAGLAEVPLGRALLFGFLSSLAWNGLVMGAGVAVGGNLEKLQALMGQYQRAAGFLVVVAAVGLALRWWTRRRRAGSK